MNFLTIKTSISITEIYFFNYQNYVFSPTTEIMYFFQPLKPCKFSIHQSYTFRNHQNYAFLPQTRKHVSTVHTAHSIFFSNLPALSALLIPPRKMFMNHSNEYWYIGSIFAMSATQKNRIWVFTATGMYWLLVMSISFSVCSATNTFA